MRLMSCPEFCIAGLVDSSSADDYVSGVGFGFLCNVVIFFRVEEDKTVVMVEASKGNMSPSSSGNFLSEASTIILRTMD